MILKRKKEGNVIGVFFIAIRDSFSHKAKFSGEELDIDKELKENMEEFIGIARDVILDKLGVGV